MRFLLAKNSPVKVLLIIAFFALAFSGCYKQTCPTYGKVPVQTTDADCAEV